MKLTVPYYSQFLDVQDPFWMLRACGATSLKMVAEYHGKDVFDITTLCNEAKERGGYDMTNGWVHDYLVMKAKELGLQAHRKEGLTTIDEIIAALDNANPVIVSVEKRVLEQTRFHMLVIVGYDNGQSSSTTHNPQPTTYLYYHEPESTDKERGQYRICSYDIFMEYFRGKAIFISK
jgi:uncharacterized protein YvpB